MATITIDITEKGIFNGLYNTIWNCESMDEINFEYFKQELGIDTNSIDISLNAEKYLKEIAERYVFFMIGELGGLMTIKQVYSPKEYNFDTDHIVIDWENKKLSEKEMNDKLNEFIEDNTSEWISFEESVFEDQNGTELYDNMVKYTIDGKEIY